MAMKGILSKYLSSKRGGKMEAGNKKLGEFLESLVAVDFNSPKEDYK